MLFKAVYVNVTLSTLLFFIYLFSFNCILEKNQYLGVFSIPIKYLPTIPFLFQFSPLANLQLAGASLSIAFFWKKSGVDIKALFEKIKGKTNYLLWLSLIFIVGFFFRYWNFIAMWAASPAEFCGLQGDGVLYCEMASKFLANDKFHFTTFNWGFPYLLSLLMKLTSSDLFLSLSIQNFICSTIPVIVFFITKQTINLRTAFWAALFSALSYNLIYQSVVVGRAGFTGFFLICIIFLLLKHSFKKNWLVLFGLGVLGGLLSLVSGELLPILFLCLITQYKFFSGRALKSVSIFIFGFILAQTSFQINVYKSLDTFWPLGRPLAELKNVSNFFASSEAGRLLTEKGINVLANPKQTFLTLIESPIQSFALITKRFFSEFLSYIFDHQPFYLDPVFLQHETYFSGTLLFYVLLVLAVGVISFIRAKEVSGVNKLLFGIPLIYSLLFFTLIHSGWARFVSAVQPLYLIILAFGFVKSIDWFFPRDMRNRDYADNALIADKSPPSKVERKMDIKNLVFYRFALGGFLFFVVILFIWNFNYFSSFKSTTSNYYVRYKGQRIPNYKNYYFLGQYYNEKNESLKAIDAFKISANSNNYFGNLYVEYSNIQVPSLYLKLKKYKEAKFYFARMIKNYPDSKYIYIAINNLASIYAKEGKMDEAIQIFKKGVELNIQHPDIYFNLAQALRKKNEFKQALKYFRLAVKLEPTFNQAIQAISKLESQIRILEESKKS